MRHRTMEDSNPVNQMHQETDDVKNLSNSLLVPMENFDNKYSFAKLQSVDDEDEVHKDLNLNRKNLAIKFHDTFGVS